MLRHFRHSALTALALMALAGPALAVDSTFSLSPTSGVVPLHVDWSDSVTLSGVGSTWTSAVLVGHNYTNGTGYIEVPVDIDQEGPYVHGGSWSFGFTIYEIGLWNFGQTNHGLTSNSTPWDLGSEDIYVTVTVGTGGSETPGGGGG